MSTEPRGIGERNEKSLHAALKQWYARPGDVIEARVDGYIVDIVRGDLLVEIQTHNWSAIRRKLHKLLEHHPVRLVYPIPREQWIVRVDRRGQVIGRRKSPRRGEWRDLFEELVYLPELIAHPNLTLEIALIRAEEVRRADGKGSWRRRGQSRVDSRLLGVVETRVFERPEDFLAFLPGDLEPAFSNQQLAAQLGLSVARARRITYCLRKMRMIRTLDKRGNELVFAVNRP